MQMQSIVPSLRRFDVQYIYYADTDTLSVYFAKASPGVIATSEDIAPGILADYTSQKQVVSIDLFSASKGSVCHFYDSHEVIDNKPQLAIMWDYDQVRDLLAVYLHPHPAVGRCVETEDSNIQQGMDAAGLWQALFFNNASQTVLCPAA